MVRRIIRVERKGVVWEVGENWVDGYEICAIEFRQQGLTGVNNIINAGAQPSYLIVMVNPISDKDRKFTVVPSDVDSVTFVEEEAPKKDEIPELRKVD
jgi:hypothetical protein